jgi:hypothetical protein
MGLGYALSPYRLKERPMSALEWILAFGLAVLYFALIFFFGIRTFQRGRLVLGILGIFLPFLWVIGGLLPDKHPARTA